MPGGADVPVESCGGSKRSRLAVFFVPLNLVMNHLPVVQRLNKLLVDVAGIEPATPCLQTGGKGREDKSKSLFGLRLAHVPPEPTP